MCVCLCLCLCVCDDLFAVLFQAFGGGGGGSGGNGSDRLRSGTHLNKTPIVLYSDSFSAS